MRLFGINDLEMVDRIFVSWNPLISWLRWLDAQECRQAFRVQPWRAEAHRAKRPF
jgi:hypothetical protein